MKIKIEKNKQINTSDLYKLLNLDISKEYNFLPKLNKILSSLEKTFNHLEDEEYFVRYSEAYDGILILEKDDGSEITTLQIKFFEIWLD